MKHKDDGVPVIFRVLGSGQVVALLPANKEPLGKCKAIKLEVRTAVVECSENYKQIVKRSRLAKPHESRVLCESIRAMGIVPSVRRKWTKQDREQT